MNLVFFNVLVDSRFPILFSFFLGSFFFSLMVFLKINYYYLILLNIIFIFICLLMWVKNIFVESLIGNHRVYIQDGFKICFYYFLFSEMIFFFSLFWVYFDSSLAPLNDLGEVWLPKGLDIISPFSIPFLNSLILLGRAISLTWVHYSFLINLKQILFFFFTLLIGLIFLSLQLYEYRRIMFNFRDRIFGGLFYLITGFHGLHVFFGLLFLVFNFFQIIGNSLLVNHHLRFEFSIIYWHFVDVVWLYLFIFLYWWG